MMAGVYRGGHLDFVGQSAPALGRHVRRMSRALKAASSERARSRGRMRRGKEPRGRELAENLSSSPTIEFAGFNEGGT